jgi:hypothetical protein
VIASRPLGTMAGVDDSTHLHGRFELRHTMTMSGRVHFNDEGQPLGGAVTLAPPGERSWTGALSVSAMDAAEARRTSKRDGGHTLENAALVLTRLDVADDAAFYGLDVDWDSAELDGTVTGEAVRFSVPARWADMLDAGAGVQRATGRLELTSDRQVTYAEFVLPDGNELVVLEQQDLDVSAHSRSGLDALAASSR